jgi:hypothetical protein
MKRAKIALAKPTGHDGDFHARSAFAKVTRPFWSRLDFGELIPNAF